MTRTRISQRFTRVKFTLFRCTSAYLFFSCCDSVAAPRQRPGHHDEVPAKNNERRRGHRPRRTRIIQRSTRVKFTLFRCTSAELFFSCCESVAAPRQRPGHLDQITTKNNEWRRGQRPRHHDQLPATHNERRRGQRSPKLDHFSPHFAPRKVQFLAIFRFAKKVPFFAKKIAKNRLDPTNKCLHPQGRAKSRSWCPPNTRF